MWFLLTDDKYYSSMIEELYIQYLLGWKWTRVTPKNLNSSTIKTFF